MRLLLLTFALFAVACSAKEPSGQRVELGTVKWTRDHDAAIALSAKTGKPVFLLFQEVPGWKGCRDFGSEVLSNEKLVKRIESEFIPLLVYNNKGGDDAKLLKKYKEPSWNYPVVRFLDGKGTELIPRKDRVYSVKGISERMNLALKKAAEKE